MFIITHCNVFYGNLISKITAVGLINLEDRTEMVNEDYLSAGKITLLIVNCTQSKLRLQASTVNMGCKFSQSKALEPRLAQSYRSLSRFL